MRSRRSFLRLCLVAEVSQWLGHDSIVFRGSKSNVSRFLRLQFRNGLDAKPAGALPLSDALRPKSSTRYSLVCSLKWLAVDVTTPRGFAQASHCRRYLHQEFRSDRSHRRVILWCVRSSGSPSMLLPLARAFPWVKDRQRYLPRVTSGRASLSCFFAPLRRFGYFLVPP